VITKGVRRARTQVAYTERTAASPGRVRRAGPRGQEDQQRRPSRRTPTPGAEPRGMVTTMTDSVAARRFRAASRDPAGRPARSLIRNEVGLAQLAGTRVRVGCQQQRRWSIHASRPERGRCRRRSTATTGSPAGRGGDSRTGLTGGLRLHGNSNRTRQHLLRPRQAVPDHRPPPSPLLRQRRSAGDAGYVYDAFGGCATRTQAMA